MCKSRILIVDDDEMILAALGFSFDLLLQTLHLAPTRRDSAEK
jgi:hypothetical protein